jgi:hypothetical protein
MPPRTRRTGYDPYAGYRCTCKHLVYADDQPGGKCRFCGCTDHQAPASRPTPPVDEEAETARIWDWLQRTPHFECGGWTWDSREPDVLRCACSEALPMPERRTAA